MMNNFAGRNICLEIENEKLLSQIKQLKDEIKQLERFRDDLKCCGNCKYNEFEDMGEYREEWCRKYKESGASCAYCSYWQFDGMHQKDRKIE